MIGITATSSKKHHQLNTSDEPRQDNNVDKLNNNLMTIIVTIIVTVTREGVWSNNNEFNQTTPVSTQEEADTLLIIHAVEIVQTGFSVDFFSQDTDWLVLLLRRHDILGT
ncbi:hypothetical protein DPMN_191754 [Dreissena polymorpha]|uniref:Uncharacterized protein n=1 Tax=Dreissena polymorpha TaxID=45954 RepID=A0A9D3XZZ0_DREPO|nr:hypothetical protein DPMN_191754 [Dreissena polymorpha]